MKTNSSALIVPAEAPAGTNVVEAALRDIKPPVDVPDYWFWLWLALGILAAILAGYLLWKFWLNKKFRPVPVAPLPPHVRAKRRLREALAHLPEPEKFTVLVSGTIRIYLEERFDFHAPERTTEEFLHELQATDRLTEDQKKSLGAFLERCDLIKFARYEPTQMELEDLHNSAMRLVEETEPKPLPPTVSTPTPAAPAK